MEKLEIEVFSRQSNSAIVRMPGRKFPGVVIQGDSLSIFLDHVESALQRAQRLPDPELTDELIDLHEKLLGHLNNYSAVLGEHGIDLPFVRK
jgi:hypothetical protein